MEVLRTELEAIRIEADCCGTERHKESAEIRKGFTLERGNHIQFVKFVKFDEKIKSSNYTDYRGFSGRCATILMMGRT